MSTVREYAILYIRGTRTGGTIVGGGNAVLSSGQHALDGPEHTGQLPDTRISTAATDVTLVLRPDGTGGVVFGADAGGPEAVFDHGNMGATETVDVDDGTWHRGTLTANCAITVQGFTVDLGTVLIFEVTQDGTGGWTITWDADVEFIGEDQPDTAAGSVTVFLLFSSAGDSTIYGVRVGGGSSVAALDDLSDVVITSPTVYDHVYFDGTTWVNTQATWKPVSTGDGGILYDAGTGDPIMAFGPP